MHIEPGVVTGAKLALGYATATGAVGASAKFAFDALKQDGVAALALRSVMATGLAFSFFQVLPHAPVGVSEVHLILGSTLFLLFGAAPAAIGLALGLLTQGLLFAPTDLPQYGMNVTSLLVPLIAVSYLARKVVPKTTAYKDLTYSQTLALSIAFQGGVISWVAFWAFYGHGFGAENLAQVASFAGAYALVIVVEPLIDLGVLAAAKTFYRMQDSKAVHARLYQAAA